MKRFLALTIMALFLFSVIPERCLSGSSSIQEQDDAVTGTDEEQGKDAADIPEKDEDGGLKGKTKKKDLKEPEYDMDFEIDFDNDRC